MKISVSVIMPAYNAEKYLKEAIDSILNQSFKQFEFIIINDGSTDSTKKIILSYRDKRIRYIENKQNVGIIESMNRALKLAKGKYIAKMDADDISVTDRLEEEFNFLEKNPDYGVVGTGSDFMDQNGRFIKKWPTLETDADIKSMLLAGSPYVNGSTMFQKKLIIGTGGYNKNAYVAEDYELWCRLATLTKMGSINKYLYKYRVNSEGVSITKRNVQLQNADIICKKYESYFKKFFKKERLENIFVTIKDKRYEAALRLAVARRLRALKIDYSYCLFNIWKSFWLDSGNMAVYLYSLCLVLPFSWFKKVELAALRIKFS
jgi:glycosyltransferase involved in cell wall biosynthesis